MSQDLDKFTFKHLLGSFTALFLQCAFIHPVWPIRPTKFLCKFSPLLLPPLPGQTSNISTVTTFSKGLGTKVNNPHVSVLQASLVPVCALLQLWAALEKYWIHVHTTTVL